MDTLQETGSGEKAPSDIDEFKNRVGKADGALIPLRRKSDQGTDLYVSSRYIANPNMEDSPDAEKFFFGWDKDKTLGPMTGVLLVDVYAKEDDQIVPVGHMDWWLQGDYANGGGNLHSALVPKNDIEEKSFEFWGGKLNYKHNTTAFKVIPEYQRQTLGSLMLATSAITLSSLGVNVFYSGGLLDPAKSTYAHFGITPENFRGNEDSDTERWKSSQLPIERLTEHPYVNELINSFLQTPEGYTPSGE